MNPLYWIGLSRRVGKDAQSSFEDAGDVASVSIDELRKEGDDDSFNEPIVVELKEVDGVGSEKRIIPDDYDTDSLRGSGVGSFLALGVDALRTFLIAMDDIAPDPLREGEVEVPADVALGFDSVSSPDADVRVTKTAEYEEFETKEVEARESEELEVKTFSTIVAILGLSVVAALALRRIYHNGKEFYVPVDSRIDKLLALMDTKVAYTAEEGAERLGGSFTYAGGLSIYEAVGVAGERVTSSFGEQRGRRTHEGVDIALPMNTPVRSPVSGTVLRVFNDRAGGLVVTLSDDTNRHAFQFMHLNSVGVMEGDSVEAGDVIGLSGKSGRPAGGGEYGPHLHLEYIRLYSTPRVGSSIRAYGRKVNPELWDLVGEGVVTEPRRMGGTEDTLDAINYLPSDGRAVINERGVVQGTTDSPVVLDNVSFDNTSNLGYRNNNPLSVTSAGRSWHGQIGTARSKTHTFVKFESLSAGIRAGAMNLLNNYQLRYDVSGSGGEWVTISEVLHNNRYSYLDLGVGDDPNSYASIVEKVSGLDADERIDLRNEDTLIRVLAGFMVAESGTRVAFSDIQKTLRHYKITNGGSFNQQM